MKSMKEQTKPKNPFCSEAFYGTATMGERGQLVIPAEARAEMEMSAGDKILIMRHPVHKGLMLCKLEAVREFLDEFQKSLDEFERSKND